MNDIEQKIIITTETNAQETAKKVDVLTEATEQTAKSQAGATKTTQTQKQALEELAPATTGAVQGFMAMGKAAWALVANPIGAVLTAIVGAVLLLGKAFFSTEANSNKFGKGLSIISGLFSGLIKALEPVASFLVDKIAKAFDLAGKAILGTSLVLQKTLKAFGLDSAANALNSLTKAVENNVSASGKLADAEAKLQKAQRESQRIQLDYQRQAEKIRQQRDDETNSIAQRVKLNEQLGVVLQKQLKAELSIAQQQLNVANLRIKQEGESTANLDERAEALTRISDIQERISGQESEQLANANSLRNEQKALDKEAFETRKAQEAERKRLLQERIDAEKQALKELDEANRLRDEELIALDEKSKQEKFESDQENGRLALEQAKFFSDEQIRIAQAEAEQKEQIQALQIDSLSRGIDLVKNIFGKNKAVQKAAIIAENAVGIGKQIIANNTANAGALATPQAIATGGASAAPVIALNNVSTGIGIASTLLATQKALSALGGGGSAGGGGGQTGTAPTGSGATPQVQFQNSSENQIANSVTQSQQNLQVTVLESDISKAQNNVKVLVNENSF